MSYATHDTEENEDIFSSHPFFYLLLMLLGGCLIFMGVAIYTYNPADAGWTHSSTEIVTHNLGGAIGATIADTSFFIFGVSTFFLPFLGILYLITIYIGNKKKEQLCFWLISIKLIGVLFLIIATTTLSALNIDDSPNYSSGGLLGSIFSIALLKYINAINLTLAMITLWIIGFTILTSWSPLKIAEKIGEIVLFTVTFGGSRDKAVLDEIDNSKEDPFDFMADENDSSKKTSTDREDNSDLIYSDILYEDIRNEENISDDSKPQSLSYERELNEKETSIILRHDDEENNYPSETKGVLPEDDIDELIPTLTFSALDDGFTDATTQKKDTLQKVQANILADVDTNIDKQSTQKTVVMHADDPNIPVDINSVDINKDTTNLIVTSTSNGSNIESTHSSIANAFDYKAPSSQVTSLHEPFAEETTLIETTEKTIVINEPSLKNSAPVDNISVTVNNSNIDYINHRPNYKEKIDNEETANINANESAKSNQSSISPRPSLSLDEKLALIEQQAKQKQTEQMKVVHETQNSEAIVQSSLKKTEQQKREETLASYGIKIPKVQFIQGMKIVREENTNIEIINEETTNSNNESLDVLDIEHKNTLNEIEHANQNGKDGAFTHPLETNVPMQSVQSVQSAQSMQAASLHSIIPNEQHADNQYSDESKLEGSYNKISSDKVIGRVEIDDKTEAVFEQIDSRTIIMKRVLKHEYAQNKNQLYHGEQSEISPYEHTNESSKAQTHRNISSLFSAEKPSLDGSLLEGLGIESTDDLTSATNSLDTNNKDSSNKYDESIRRANSEISLDASAHFNFDEKQELSHTNLNSDMPSTFVQETGAHSNNESSTGYTLPEVYEDKGESEETHPLFHPLIFRETEKQPVPKEPLPTVELLAENKSEAIDFDNEKLQETASLIETALADFKINVTVVDIFCGPVITRFELELAPGVRAARISALDRDLARALSVSSVRVVEVIPGKPYVGLELPNPQRELLVIRDVIDSTEFKEMKSPLTMVLGKDIAGEPVVANLAKMPHLLVAGTTGSGKSVGVNAMIISILFKASPDEVKFIMIDPKMLELSIYNSIPHLLTEVVTDMKKASNALRWCVGEMERRYQLMAALGVRNLEGYNEKINLAEDMQHRIKDPLWKPSDSMETTIPYLEKLPYIVVVVDEFADLIMTEGKKIEELIARLAQKARAAGIHLILATQRPSVDVITGLIKANVPTRIAFTVSSKIDSRTILDQGGAESLLGAGDMLYLPPNSSSTIRVHGAFVGDEEVHNVVANWRARGTPKYIDEIIAEPKSSSDNEGGDSNQVDEKFDTIVQFVIETQRVSISGIQRKFNIGYNRAAKIVEEMEEQGIVSTPNNNGTRMVLAK
ncbi:DNA translocase FtsK 4TM domain-containing protein [Thorsellia kenyensis]|uniref:DNA translocase FtsK n=1 Tax=Thorsellia kenyensis TaxID=1549888 RepID=A0ABV6CB16_9GAMM